MKRSISILIFLAVLFAPVLAFGAAGTVSVAVTKDAPTGIIKVTFTCVGGTAGDAGTIPNTDITADITRLLTAKKPYYLYRVIAYPTAGGTAPDAADVFVLDANNLDLLGSEDNGTTAYAGLNLIHATLTQSTLPNIYLPRAGLHANYFPEVTGTLTLKVSNQATASADWTIELIFVEGDEQ